MTQRDESNSSWVSPEDVTQAYARSIAAYYEAEKRFVAEPDHRTLAAYHRALDRFSTLRGEMSHIAKVSEALEGDRLEPMIRDLMDKIEAKKGSCS